MSSPLRIVHWDDGPADAARVHSALDGSDLSYDCACVQDRDAFVAALRGAEVDLVLVGGSPRGSDAPTAIRLARAERPAAPVIVLSEDADENGALEDDVTDYVPNDRPRRLVRAIRRAAIEVEARAERGRLEARIIEAQKMEVIGRLVGGVAHDFNNVLAVIMGYGNLLLTRLGPDSPMRRYGQEIVRASERAAGLTRQLLVFSRKQAVQPAVLDLAIAVHDLEGLVRKLIDENISLTIECEPGAGRVEADPGHLAQLVTGLVISARDAMPGGGALTIRTRRATLDEADARANPGASAGEFVVLSVGDTGGLSMEELESRLSEPLSSAGSRGTGAELGLPVCRAIVERWGGRIAARVEAGKGTSLETFFPRAGGTPEPAAESLPAPERARGAETLLVVEDEPAIRHLTSGVLEAEGYTVLRAANGQDGLRLFREHRGPPIRLVVTDVVMPVMGGKVMAEWLRAADADLRVLFTSGYTDEVVSGDDVRRPGLGFLAKPYTPASLAQKVRDMLDGRREGPRAAGRG